MQKFVEIKNFMVQKLSVRLFCWGNRDNVNFHLKNWHKLLIYVAL